jgi:hypothetical protein
MVKCVLGLKFNLNKWTFAVVELQGLNDCQSMENVHDYYEVERNG